MSLENLSDAELEAVANGDFSKLSDATLATLSGEAPARSLGEQLKRGAGLAGRAVVQGMAAPVTAVGDFVSGLANLGSALSGSEARVPVPSQALSQALTKAGVPSPETGMERAAQAGMEGMTSTAGAARALPGTMLATDMARQIPSSAVMGAVSQPTAEAVKSLTGSDVAATIAGLGLGVIAAKTTGDIAGAVAARGQPVLTMNEVRQRAQRAYNTVDELGITLTPQSSADVVARVNTNLEAARYLPENAPAIRTVLNEFDAIVARGPVSFDRLDKMRALANDLKTNQDPNIRRLAGNMVSTIDDYVAGLNPRDVSAGAGGIDEAVKTIMGARKDWRNLSRATTLENILDTAEIRALNPNLSESELIRKGFINLAASKPKMRFFTEDEQTAIKSVAKGGPLDPLLTFMAKFNPERSALVGAGTVAGAVAKPEYAIPIGLAGITADRAQTLLRQRAAQQAMGGLLSGTTPKPLPTTSLRSLLSGAVNESYQ